MTIHCMLHFLTTSILAVLIWQRWFQDRSKGDEEDCRGISDPTPSCPPSNRTASMAEHVRDTSVWCSGDHNSNRVCHFRNLYYFPDLDEFAFLHGDASFYFGLPANRFDPALLDMSTIMNHNTQYFNYIDLEASKARNVVDGAIIVGKRSLIFRRFHPDNLMHVIHDDLLPMYYTLLALDSQFSAMGRNENEAFEMQLIFMEGWKSGPHRELYELFSVFPPIYKDDLLAEKKPICFTDAVVGLSKHTTWYQYGFEKPQGPIQDSNVSATDIHRFCSFVRTRLNISENNESNGNLTVLITRKYNRLILNEFNLSFVLAQTLHTKVLTMAIETHSMTELIAAVSRAKVLIGMHGSLLSLAMFLRPGSLLVELFPFAVNPVHYTPYKTLADVPGMGITYVAWRNVDHRNTVVHPDNPWHQGGIKHLSLTEQAQILASREVPLHLCCRNPEWLFRIYQDTVVDTDAVIQLIRNGLAVISLSNGDPPPAEKSRNKNVFPSRVQNISCKSNSGDGITSLLLSWGAPTNLNFIDFQTIKYELWLQEAGSDDYLAYMLTKTSHEFRDEGLKRDSVYNVWIRSIVNDVIGPFNSQHAFCTT